MPEIKTPSHSSFEDECALRAMEINLKYQQEYLANNGCEELPHYIGKDLAETCWELVDAMVIERNKRIALKEKDNG